MASAPALRLELFGRPALWRDRDEVALSPMQWALVALVFGAAGGRGARAELVHMLWEGVDESTGLKRLSQLIYEVEQRAGGALFLKTGLTVRPDRTQVSCDVGDFEAALASDDLGEAARRLVDGFLEGIPEVPTDRFDRWIDQRIASLRAKLRGRATKRWSRAEDEGVWNQRTTDAANALLYLSPASEAALRRAVWAEAMSGSPLEAIATLESFVETNGLGGQQDLENETLTLLERVRALSRHRKGSHVERPRPSRADPTLYGREQELARLRPLIAGPIEDGITVVAVGGEAGLGKSRLVRECLEPAMLQGRLILRTTLSELERDIPLNALIEAMATQDVARAVLGLEEPWRSVILSLMPSFVEVAGTPATLPYVQPASLQRRLLESVRLLIDEVVGEQPILLFIDDFHWADDSSLAALEYVRRRWSIGSMVLVVAYRPEHVAPGSPVSRFLEADSVERLPLGPLAEVARKQLVKEAAGGDVPDAVVDGLKELGGGNPLFLIELARQWADGELELPTRHVDRIQLPVSLQQLFERRLVGFDATTTRVLEALSVLAKRTPMSVIQTVSGLSQAEVADGLEALDRAGLLRWDTVGVALWHGLVRQAVVASMSEARLRWLHGQVGSFLVRSGSGELDEIALHMDRARRSKEALRFAELAANQAEEVGAIPEAVLFLEVASRNCDAAAMPRVLARLAGLQYRQCWYKEALASYSALLVEHAHYYGEEQIAGFEVRRFDCDSHLEPNSASLPGRLEKLEEIALGTRAWEALAWLVRVGADYLARTDRIDEVPRLLRHIRAGVDARDARARCVAHQAGFLLRLHDVDVDLGRRHGERALHLARTYGFSDLLPRSYLAQVINLHLDGSLETDSGKAVASEALAAAGRYGDLHARFKLTSNYAAFFLDVGDTSRALRFLDDAKDLLDGVDFGSGSAHYFLNRADLAIQMKDFGLAQSFARQVLPVDEANAWYGWAVTHAVLGRCALELGRMAEAQRHADELAAVWPHRLTPLLDVAFVTTFRSRLLTARGRRHDAIQILESAEATLLRLNVAQFLRVRYAKTKLLRRCGDASARTAASEGFERASALGLGILARRFGTVLEGGA